MIVMDKNKIYILSSIVFAFFVCWWVSIQLNVRETNQESANLFVDSYYILALIGSIVGLVSAQVWGGKTSVVGKSLLLYSIGLLLQFLGQLSYTIIYRTSGIENAYPSFGELFYIFSVPCYIIATLYMAKASGIRVTTKNMYGKTIAVIIPVAMISLSYIFFLGGYEAEQGLPKVGILLDYFYPVSQAIFVSLAILTVQLTRGVLGGIMRDKVIILMLALIFQYLADSFFIYRTRAGLWYPGGISDLLFLISYFLMIVAITRFVGIEKEIRKAIKM